MFHHGQLKKDAHEQMGRHVGRLRARAKLMRQTLREALYGRLGSVVRSVTPVKMPISARATDRVSLRCLRRIRNVRDAKLGSCVDND
jgi:hypothetical protein